ncbi:uncharacterized protein LOC131044625 [Cryptomeria japonica]|uniref:uncharacterized protein LOC131044625 n=1 Tax=Cryptomeria japonica TaxID=3369 RepID=UPI0027DA83F1|nr:uncharacterized protein LOC131044625 [Cryptomeria japonica]
MAVSGHVALSDLDCWSPVRSVWRRQFTVVGAATYERGVARGGEALSTGTYGSGEQRRAEELLLAGGAAGRGTGTERNLGGAAAVTEAGAADEGAAGGAAAGELRADGGAGQLLGYRRRQTGTCAVSDLQGTGHAGAGWRMCTPGRAEMLGGATAMGGAATVGNTRRSGCRGPLAGSGSSGKWRLMGRGGRRGLLAVADVKQWLMGRGGPP